ncbi:hypothetical protein AAFF_G00062740 [Aldrovandia affinis]|uniref:Uncharacterized protein n=1 Tax=Aldrovandia affinis TaxID=143900 RepID=A0AAD7RZR3_9TELE|nr:hypothetical protein AAFF_G00062740 [Aldrovandia affinis]
MGRLAGGAESRLNQLCSFVLLCGGCTAAEEQVQDMPSPWAAPAVLVKKKDDSWRFCVNYRRLNAVTKKDYISGSSCDLRSFLRLASYYRWYVQDFATIASLLHRLTDRGRSYIWDDPCSMAFKTLQTASNVGVDEVLSQQGDNGEQAVDGKLAGWLPLTPSQVQEEQEQDATLTHVRGWLAAGREPEWADDAALNAETNTATFPDLGMASGCGRRAVPLMVAGPGRGGSWCSCWCPVPSGTTGPVCLCMEQRGLCSGTTKPFVASGVMHVLL